PKCRPRGFPPSTAAGARLPVGSSTCCWRLRTSPPTLQKLLDAELLQLRSHLGYSPFQRGDDMIADLGRRQGNHVIDVVGAGSARAHDYLGGLAVRAYEA